MGHAHWRGSSLKSASDKRCLNDPQGAAPYCRHTGNHSGLQVNPRSRDRYSNDLGWTQLYVVLRSNGSRYIEFTQPKIRFPLHTQTCRRSLHSCGTSLSGSHQGVKRQRSRTFWKRDDWINIDFLNFGMRTNKASESKQNLCDSRAIQSRRASETT